MKVNIAKAERSDGSGKGIAQAQIKAFWAYNKEGQKFLGEMLKAACSPFPSLELESYEPLLFAAYDLQEYRRCTDDAWKMNRRIRSDHSMARINCKLGEYDSGEWSPGWCGEKDDEEGILTLKASGGREISLYIDFEGKDCPVVIITADYTVDSHEPSVSSVRPLLDFFRQHRMEVEDLHPRRLRTE